MPAHQQGRLPAAAIILLLVTAMAAAQSRPEPAAQGFQSNAQGSLTVTLTVASSVGVVIGPDGKQYIVAANAADPADNVSQIQYVRLKPVNKHEQKQSDNTKKDRAPAKPDR